MKTRYQITIEEINGRKFFSVVALRNSYLGRYSSSIKQFPYNDSGFQKAEEYINQLRKLEVTVKKQTQKQVVKPVAKAAPAPKNGNGNNLKARLFTLEMSCGRLMKEARALPKTAKVADVNKMIAELAKFRRTLLGK